MFYDKFFNSANLKELLSPFNVVSFGFQFVCIEGKCNVVMFSSTKIVLSIKKEKMFVFGKNLTILDMDSHHITIAGNIDAISKKEIKLNE